MAEYIPTPVQWVREHVERYEGSGGTEGVGLMDTGLPCVIVTHTGNKDGDKYVLVGSQGGAPKNPVWVYNLRANPTVEIRDATEVSTMRVREVEDADERDRIWATAVEAFPPYADYKERTSRTIPVFIAEPI